MTIKSDLKNTTSTKSIIEALKSLFGADPKKVESIFTDIETQLAKAAQDLSESEMIPDRWQSGQMHQGIRREQVMTGPQGSASGDGAQRMVAHYSETTPQQGTSLTAESLSRLLGPLNSSMKAMQETQKKQQELLVSLFKSLEATAKAEDDKDDEDEDESSEANSEKAKSLFKKAKRTLAKAADEDEKKVARALKSEAGVLAGQARGHARLAGDLTFDKSVRAWADDNNLKADISLSKSEDEDKDEEDAKAKAEAKAKEEAEAKAKAEAEAKAKEEAEAKAKAEAAAAAGTGGAMSGEQMTKAMDAVLSGQAMLTGTIKSLMDAMAGRSKDATVPSFAKAKEEDTVTLRDRIGTLNSEGALNDTDTMAAREICDKISAVAKGQLPENFVTDRIAKSSATVKALFADFPKAKAA